MDSIRILVRTMKALGLATYGLIKTLNPKPLNPQPLNLNPKPLNPKP